MHHYSQTATPFLKWAGGKTQLLGAIQKSLPKELTSKKFSYVEPFVGSGTVLFWMLRTFENIEIENNSIFEGFLKRTKDLIEYKVS